MSTIAMFYETKSPWHYLDHPDQNQFRIVTFPYFLIEPGSSLSSVHNTNARQWSRQIEKLCNQVNQVMVYNLPRYPL